MNEREILTRFKAGTLNRGQATQLLADLAARETVPRQARGEPGPTVRQLVGQQMRQI